MSDPIYIGRTGGNLRLYVITPKRYSCNRCGHIETQSTNHYGPTWSHGRMGCCPKCPPWAKYSEFGGSTQWTCLDEEPKMKTTHKVKPTEHTRSLCIADMECALDTHITESPAGQVAVLVRDMDGFPSGPYMLPETDIEPLPTKVTA